MSSRRKSSKVPAPPAPLHATREQWLLAGCEQLIAIIARKTGHKVPPFCVSVGFPKGARGRGRAIGQCWATECAADGKFHLFVSPELAEATRVLDVALHELIHAAVGLKAKHNRPFIEVASAVGLVKPWTATTAGKELAVRLNTLASELGAYPHGALIPVLKPKPGSRLRLYICACGTKVRVASDSFDATCNACDETFERVQ